MFASKENPRPKHARHPLSLVRGSSLSWGTYHPLRRLLSLDFKILTIREHPFDEYFKQRL